MKRILIPIVIALTFTVMFSSTSYADWTKVSESVEGNTFYVDFERVRKHGGYAYFWILQDNLKPDKFGVLSSQVYYRGDCKLFRYEFLSFNYHKEPMGRGIGETQKPVIEVQGWDYPPPNSSIESILKKVCSR